MVPCHIGISRAPHRAHALLPYLLVSLSFLEKFALSLLSLLPLILATTCFTWFRSVIDCNAINRIRRNSSSTV